MHCTRQNRILLQFHITGRCNLRCKHCYRTEGDTEPLSYEDLIKIVEQYRTLRKAYNAHYGIKAKGHINITGGEPFFRKDIRDFLLYLGEHEKEFSYGILSNGSFLTPEITPLLRQTKVSFVQLSLDGDRETHDQLRAPGDYDRVLKTARFLEKEGIRTYISFTANKDNFKHLPAVARQCRRRKITKLWSDRLVPMGTGQQLEDLAITKELFPHYVRTLKKAQGSFLTKLLYPKTQVTMNRALQFQDSEGAMYSCSAGNSLITVDEFGNIMPCRRMPILCGNVSETTLEEVYFRHPIFLELRKELIPKECSQCPYKYRCKGGARCQSYALYGSYRRADPGCPLRCPHSGD